MQELRLTRHESGSGATDIGKRLIATTQNGSQSRMGSLLDQNWRRYLGHADTDPDPRSTPNPHGDVDSQTVDERSDDDDDDSNSHTSSSTVLGRDVVTHEGRGYRRQEVRCRHETKSVSLGVVEESAKSHNKP